MDEFDAEELQISEYLKTHVSDEKPDHGDSETNLPSEHTTDAFTLTSQCLKPAIKSPKTSNHPAPASSDLEEARQDSRSGSEGVKDDVKSRDKNSAPSKPIERPESNVHPNSKTEKDICGSVSGPNNENERCIASSVDETCGKKWECLNGEVTAQGNTNSNVEDSKQETEHPGKDQSVSGPQRPSTASSRSKGPDMFPGRDDPGRGLGRPPLGTPSSLSAPPPLGRPPLGAPPLGGARVPPIGGQLTPLAPIAAASRGGSTHLVSATLCSSALR